MQYGFPFYRDNVYFYQGCKTKMKIAYYLSIRVEKDKDIIDVDTKYSILIALLIA